MGFQYSVKLILICAARHRRASHSRKATFGNI